MLKSTNICRDYRNVTRVLETWIYNRRKELGLSQLDLAERTGHSRNCIQQLECYEHLPQHLTLLSLTDAVELSEDEYIQFHIELRKAYHTDLQIQNRQAGECEAG